MPAGGRHSCAGLNVYKDEVDVPAELFAMDTVVLSGHSAELTSESMWSNPRAKRPSGHTPKKSKARAAGHQA